MRLNLFQIFEEEGDFRAGGVRAVGPVDEVFLYAPGEILPDGARRGLAVVGGAHEVPVHLDGVFPLQDQGHDGAGTHEFGEAGVKVVLFMHRIKGPGLLPGEAQHLHGPDFQAGPLEPADDLADQPPPHAVGFDEG